MKQWFGSRLTPSWAHPQPKEKKMTNFVVITRDDYLYVTTQKNLETAISKIVDECNNIEHLTIANFDDHFNVKVYKDTHILIEPLGFSVR